MALDQTVKARYGRSLETMLREWYEDEKLSLASIAGRLGVSSPTIRWWMNRYDIHIRTPKEAGAYHTGEQNPAYHLVRTPEHRKKLSDAQKRRFASGAVPWNTGRKLTAGHRERIAGGLDRYYSTHHGPNAGKTGRHAVTFGQVPPPSASRGHFITEPVNGVRIHVRSMAEAVFAGVCLANGIEVEFEPRTFDLGVTTYTPDFYLPSLNLYVEIKGIPVKYWVDKAHALSLSGQATLAVLSELETYVLSVSHGGHRALGSDEDLPPELQSMLRPLSATELEQYLRERVFDAGTTVDRLRDHAREMKEIRRLARL